MGNLRMNADQISYKGGEKPMSVEEAIKNAGNTGLAHTADIAPDFSAESAYNAGDLVYHNGTLYVFTSNHAAGAWSTDDTQAVTVGGEITSLMSGFTNVTALAHQDYIDAYQNGVTVHVYLRSSSTPTPSDSNTLLRDLPIPKGATIIFTTMSYHDGTSRHIGLLKVNQLGQILIDGLDDSALKGVSYLVGELVYLIN